ncbi:MAG: VCBS repeat-containing protein, partial [Bryobacteraceae bacterium]
TILMGSQSSGPVTREFAIRPQIDPAKAPHSKNALIPLIVDLREVMDVEYFTFKSVDAPSAYPTSGFVSVSNEAELRSALNLGWGTVIEVNPSQPLVLNPQCQSDTSPGGLTCDNYQLKAGVTLRGYRKHLSTGAIIYACGSDTTTPGGAYTYGVFDVAADDVRITNLRLYGALNQDGVCKQAKSPPPQLDAVIVCRPIPTSKYSSAPNQGCVSSFPRVLIDHMEIAYFHSAGVNTNGVNLQESDFENCPCPAFQGTRDTPVRVIGNLIHDNNNGQASVAGKGAYVLNRANVMYGQIEAENIDSDPIGSTGYLAYDNFILSVKSSSAMDMHGSGCPNGTKSAESPPCTNSWERGISGDAFDIEFNTFLPTGGAVIVQRGTPCRTTTILNNVFLQPTQASAISSYTIYPQDKLKVAGNLFHVSDPTTDLGVGDFDGDGVADVFVGTGRAWYYSSGGQSEWRFLNRAGERASKLLFGDFDGDGRTDVIALHGKNIDISWGGISPWQTINTTDATLSDMAVGDFDGDGVSDLFVSDGKTWSYASGGSGAWTLMATSSYRAKDLLFGDFLHKGRTLALRIHDGQWLAAGVNMPWTNIGASGASSIKGLVVGDFNHDGYADVAATRSGKWQYSTPALGKGWTTLRTDTRNIAALPVADFTGDGTSDVLFWKGLRLDLAVSGVQLQPRSLQNMR